MGVLWQKQERSPPRENEPAVCWSVLVTSRLEIYRSRVLHRQFSLASQNPDTVSLLRDDDVVRHAGVSTAGGAGACWVLIWRETETQYDDVMYIAPV